MPTLTSVANAASGVTVTWGKVTGAAKYRVYYKVSTASTWTKAGDTTSTSYTVTGLTSGAEYTFMVRCVTSDGSAYASGYNKTGLSITYIAAPTLKSVSNVTGGVTVKWGAVTGATKYRVFYKVSGASSWTKAGDTTSTSYTVTDLTAGTTYVFTVKCISPSGSTLASSKSITFEYAVELMVTYDQTETRSMLVLINAFRTGADAWYWNSDNSTKTVCTDLEELTYDYTLEKIAMQRAVEIALSFSHTRPDGTSCFTAYDEFGYTGSTMGENIAMGYTTAEAVFEGWQETDDNYSGQGHRRNMLGANFTAVGIGHVYYNGYHYWVQEFGSSVQNTTATEAVDSQQTVIITVTEDYVS